MIETAIMACLVIAEIIFGTSDIMMTLYAVVAMSWLITWAIYLIIITYLDPYSNE